MKDLLKRFAADQSGATAIEYGMIVAFVALIAVVALSTMGASLSNMFNATANRVSNIWDAAGQ